MNKLYIIGNGFDKFHGLPTGYDDFHLFLSNYSNDLVNCLDEYFQFSTNKKSLWSNFEQDLRTFDWKSFYDNNNNIYFNDESFKPSDTYGLEDDLIQKTDDFVYNIKEAFGSWINQINLEPIEKKIDIDIEAVFINFNYTLTLEEIYNVPNDRVFHIHGMVRDYTDSLIFGHNANLDEDPEIDENGDSNRTIFTDSENAAKYPFYEFQKPVSEIITRNKKFFESISGVKEIIIFGHSLSNIDYPYFQEIKQNINKNVIWEVSYYNEGEHESHLRSLSELGIERSNIRLFCLQSCNVRS